VVGPVTPVGDIHGVDTLNYTKGEKLVRGKLASCYRLADINGWSQGLDAFLSVCFLFSYLFQCIHKNCAK
jgi:hypothetical protein